MEQRRQKWSVAAWVAAIVFGLYLALVPFLSYVLPVHNPKCPCHTPERLIKERWQTLFSPTDKAWQRLPQKLRPSGKKR